MGAVPSREACESPNAVYFMNDLGFVAFRVPLISHFFPSADCSLFKELHHALRHQPCKYRFDTLDPTLRVAPEAQEAYDAAVAASRQSDGGGEEEGDPESEAGSARAGLGIHRYAVGGAEEAGEGAAEEMAAARAALYRRLVEEPAAHMEATDAAMADTFAAEQRWAAARGTVRRARAGEAVSAAELEAAERVPPPPRWLCPVPEVLLERMLMGDAAALHAEYRSKHGLSAGGGGGGAERGAAGRGGMEEHSRGIASGGTLDEVQLSLYPKYYRDALPFEHDERYMDGRVHVVEWEGCHYLFAYNPAYLRANGITPAVTADDVARRMEHRRRHLPAGARAPFTTTHEVATALPEDFSDPNQTRAYELLAPVYQRYYIPVMPVRVLGVDGQLPERRAECSAATYALLHDVAEDAEEEAYLRALPSPPPVMRACRFVSRGAGERILGRSTALSFLLYGERCLLAGLPAPIARPLRCAEVMSEVPMLQLAGEMEFRLLAALREVDDGDSTVRDDLEGPSAWNAFQPYINSPMYGFMRVPPPEVVYRGVEEEHLQRLSRSLGAPQMKRAREEAEEVEAEGHAERDDAARHAARVRATEQFTIPAAQPGVSDSDGADRRLCCADVFFVNRNLVNFMLTKLGAHQTLRGRLVVLRYTHSLMQKLYHRLACASAPVFCAPYAGRTRDNQTVQLHGTVRPCELDAALARYTPEAREAQTRGHLVGLIVAGGDARALAALHHDVDGLQRTRPELLRHLESAAAGYPPETVPELQDLADGASVVIAPGSWRWMRTEVFMLLCKVLVASQHQRSAAAAAALLDVPTLLARVGETLTTPALAAALLAQAHAYQPHFSPVLHELLSKISPYTMLDLLIMCFRGQVNEEAMKKRSDPHWLRRADGQLAVIGGSHCIWTYLFAGHVFFHGARPKFMRQLKSVGGGRRARTEAAQPRAAADESNKKTSSLSASGDSSNNVSGSAATETAAPAEVSPDKRHQEQQQRSVGKVFPLLPTEARRISVSVRGSAAQHHRQQTTTVVGGGGAAGEAGTAPAPVLVADASGVDGARKWEASRRVYRWNPYYSLQEQEQ